MQRSPPKLARGTRTLGSGGVSPPQAPRSNRLALASSAHHAALTRSAGPRSLGATSAANSSSDLSAFSVPYHGG